MKTARKAQKNIREIGRYFVSRNFVKKLSSGMPYLSGVPPFGRYGNHTEGAVNMDEFPQFEGVYQ